MKLGLVSFLIVFALGNTFAHVLLDSPKGGENFDPNEIVEIRWRILVEHEIENWDLYFSPDGGDTWEELAIDLPATQLSFTWTVPDIVASNARIRIVMDNVLDNYDNESTDFAIGVYIPLKLNYPMGNENFLYNTTEQISWQVNGSVSFDSWKVLFSVDGGYSWMEITKDLPPTTLKYNWTVPNMSTTLARIKVEMNIGGTIYQDISGIFRISENVVTGLSDDEAQKINMSVYPNPFRQQTTIRLNLIKPTAVKLTIYNQIGKLVYVRAIEGLVSGIHTINWQPTSVSTGIYYYRLLLGSSSTGGKLIYQQ